MRRDLSVDCSLRDGSRGCRVHGCRRGPGGLSLAAAAHRGAEPVHSCCRTCKHARADFSVAFARPHAVVLASLRRKTNWSIPESPRICCERAKSTSALPTSFPPRSGRWFACLTVFFVSSLAAVYVMFGRSRTRRRSRARSTRSAQLSELFSK